MVATYLVPVQVQTKNGAGEVVPIEPVAMQVTLGIEEAVEQESLDVAIWGSADGTEWGKNPVAIFPQKFYHGLTSMVIDFSKTPEVRFVQIRWAMNRWGRGSLTPMFRFFVAWERV